VKYRFADFELFGYSNEHFSTENEDSKKKKSSVYNSARLKDKIVIITDIVSIRPGWGNRKASASFKP